MCLFILWPNKDGVLVRQPIDASRANFLGYRAHCGKRYFELYCGVYTELTAPSKKVAKKWVEEGIYTDGDNAPATAAPAANA